MDLFRPVRKTLTDPPPENATAIVNNILSLMDMLIYRYSQFVIRNSGS